MEEKDEPTTEPSRKDSTKDRIRKENVEAIMALVQKAGVFNITSNNRDLQNIFTGTVATNEQHVDILSFNETGTTELTAYVKSRIMHIPMAAPPRRQQSLRTFAPATKRK